MGPLVIVEPEVGSQFPAGLPRAGVGFQVHLLVLHRAPQPLDEDVVRVPPLPVHADLHTAVLKDLGELLTGELAPMVSIEHLRPPPIHRLGQGLDAEACLKSVGQAPGHYVPAVPVHDRHQVEESSCHWYVGYICRPNLVGSGDFGLLQQIGIAPYSRRRVAGPGSPVDGPQPHDPHQPLHPLPVHRYPPPLQPGLHPP